MSPNFFSFIPMAHILLLRNNYFIVGDNFELKFHFLFQYL